MTKITTFFKKVLDIGLDVCYSEYMIRKKERETTMNYINMNAILDFVGAVLFCVAMYGFFVVFTGTGV